jgi:HD-GYP domain-containing protein (c-di-GMP phosphodiesterase class II)
MTTDRPYRPGMTHDAALRDLSANAGTQFDPSVVRHFIKSNASQPEAAPSKHTLTLVHSC